MAIGAVISHRNFPSFIASGKVHQPEQAILNQRAERVGYSGTQYNHKNMFTEKLSTLRGNYPFSRNLYCNSHRVTGATIRPRAALYYDGVQPYSVPQHRDGKNRIFTPRRPLKGKCECFLSLTPQGSNWTLPRKLNNLCTTSGHFQHCTEIRTRAGYRSEDNDISGTDSDSFVSSEGGQGEAILAQEVQQIKPWWEIPKRWVIVLLCFTAFLLCNMDRVNMSIAILPMSKEFNWNSATVGLIQSSFFWGYLLTQIVGGIWADKIGGKKVLGFGVIWWSAATVLTPIAAKLGLPFLLVMRAFMGIGEGVAMPAMNNILSKWIPVSERSRSLALVYSGMYLGSVTGLAVSPALIHKFGWPSVFYSFGSLGSLWFALWLKKA